MIGVHLVMAHDTKMIFWPCVAEDSNGQVLYINVFICSIQCGFPVNHPLWMGVPATHGTGGMCRWLQSVLQDWLGIFGFTRTVYDPRGPEAIRGAELSLPRRTLCYL